jgi:hypothetical protein
MNEIGALIVTFTHLQTIAKTLLNLRDFEKLNATVIDLQNAIITAQQQAIAMQQGYTVLEAEKRKLEAECMRLKDWSAEKQQYTSRQIAPGVFAYVENKVVSGFQNAHKYCCNCFEQGQKSLLQQDNSIGDLLLKCPRRSCNFMIVFSHYLEPSE